MTNSARMHDLFVKDSHHASVSVIFTTQNHFSKGKYSTTITRNVSELVLFDSKSDKQVLTHIGKLCNSPILQLIN